MTLKNAIYGLALGDALGVPFEFKERGTFTCSDMVGWGTWNQEPGTWSDDTSMTLATCKSIQEKGYIDTNDIRDKFKQWAFEDKFTTNGKTFDIGNTTYEALSLGYGLDDFNSNGNGSLMRILPLAFVDVTDEEIEAVSAITHAHEISKKACVKYVHIARELVNGKRDLLNKFDIHYPIISDGYVVNTLNAAMFCIKTSNSYEEAVLKAVNLGDDTDTTAAVTGGLAGIIWEVPKKWINKLKNKEYIDKCLF